MRYSQAIKILQSIKFRNGSVRNRMRKLILEREIIHNPTTSEEIATKVSELMGRRIYTNYILAYMKPFLNADVVRSKYVDGKTKRIWYGSWVNLKKFRLPMPRGVLPQDTVRRLGREFKIEIDGLNLVWGRHGDCTAFLLRKILEKAIYIAFARNRMLHVLKNKGDPKKFVGLQEMIKIASTTNAKNGTPFLSTKVANELKGIKFLGDTAAHDFLYNVQMKDIEREMVYISIALGQLSGKFK